MADELKSAGKYRVMCSAGLTLPVLRKDADDKLIISMDLVKCQEMVDCGEETKEMLKEIDKGWLIKWTDDHIEHKDYGVITKTKLKELTESKIEDNKKKK